MMAPLIATPSKDCIGGKAASEIFKISMRACVSQFVRLKENLATALKLYAHGLTFVTRMGGCFYAHSSLNVDANVNEPRTQFAKNTNARLLCDFVNYF